MLRLSGIANKFHLFCSAARSDITNKAPLEATAGRLVVQFISDPVAVLRSLSQLVRPGGVLAFQDVSYVPFLLFSAHLPLWSAGVSIIHETSNAQGPTQREIELALHRIFQEARLPSFSVRSAARCPR